MRPARRRSELLLAIGIVAAMSASACGDSAPDASLVTIRDSAGVRITETPGDPWTTEPRWRLSPGPVARIGAVAGDPPYQFDEVVDIAILNDGRIVVANRGSGAIRWFDPQGIFLFERGRAGSGPGEFRHLRTLTVGADDSVVAFDPVERRMTWFAKDGVLGPTVRIARFPSSTTSWTADRLASGSWVIGRTGISSPDLPPQARTGIVRPTAPMLVVSPDGARTDTLGVFPGMDIEVASALDGRRWGPARFGKRLSYAVSGDYIYVGTADRTEVEVFTADGKLVRSIRAPEVDVAMTPERESEYKSFLRARSSRDRAELERTIAALILPPTVPAYNSLMVDATGHLWLAEYRYDLTPARRYVVFDPDGRFVSVVEVPERFTVRTITRDQVWGVATDSLDVEYVIGYTIGR